MMDWIDRGLSERGLFPSELNRLLRVGLLPCVLIAVCFLADCQSSQGQGLLRRLRSRIQSRIESIPPQIPPTDAQGGQTEPNRLGSPLNGLRDRLNSSGSLNPNGRVPAYRPPNTTDDSNGVTPQRLSPIDGNGFVQRPRGFSDSNSRPRLGMRVAPETRDGVTGVTVQAIHPDSYADDAGIQVGDFILALDRMATPSTLHIHRHLSNLPPTADHVEVSVLRGGRAVPVRMRLIRDGDRVTDSALPGTRPLRAAADPLTLERFGIEVLDRPGQRGAEVVRVLPGSMAAMSGIQPGDRIVSVDGRVIVDANTLQRVLAGSSRVTDPSSTTDSHQLQIVRGENLIAIRTDQRHGNNPGQSGIAGTGSENGTASGEAQASQAESAPSLLKSVGSVFGGLWSGSAKDPDPASSQDGTTNKAQKPSANREQQSKTQQRKTQQRKTQQRKTPSGDTDGFDPLALGDDDQPVRQAAFDSPTGSEQAKPNDPIGDPVSVQELPPPQGTLDRLPPNPGQTFEPSRLQQLEEEIQRLRAEIDLLKRTP